MDKVAPETLYRLRELPTHWDPELVAVRLVRAFITLDRMPAVSGPRQPGGHWPTTEVEWGDQIAWQDLDESEKQMRRDEANSVINRPGAAEIKNMEMAFSWLAELRAFDSGMALVITLWAMRTARGRSIRRLCRERHWVEYTFFRKRAKGLAFLASALNARGIQVA
jgi:hypothetical protein